MNTKELTKEIKSKIETFTYDGIDEAIKLAEMYGTVDFFDKFLGKLQLRCIRYNSNHVCSEAKFFNRGTRAKSSHFTYRALLGLVNIACKGSQAYEYRNNMKEIQICGHIFHDGVAYYGNVDLKYITNFSSLTDIRLDSAGSISNLEVINNLKNLKCIAIDGPLTALQTIPYSLENIPLISNRLFLPNLKWECNSLEVLTLSSIEEIEDFQFISELKNLKVLQVVYSNINSLKGIPSSIEKFTFYGGAYRNNTINDSEFQILRNLKKLKFLEITSKNADFSFLRDLTELEQLTINTEVKNALIPDLKNLKKLRYLSIYRTAENLDFVRENKNIEWISIERSDIKNIKGLENCNKINIIHIKDCENLASLSGLEKCKELDIFIGSAGLENLDELRNCTRLCCFKSRILEDFHKHDFATTEVETYSDGTNNLNSVIRDNTLHIQECNNLTNIAGIQNATNLMGLRITYCKKIKKIEGIETLKNLHEIDFSNCTELEDISIIKSFPKLKYLDLSGCKKLKVKPEKLILETEAEIEKYKSKL